MKVRSATGPMMLAAIAALIGPLWGPEPVAAGQGERAADRPRVTIAVLPRATRLEELAAAAPEASPGILSAGLGRVAAEQTYLDISQGNRLFDSLYPAELGPASVAGDRVPPADWRRIVERADRAPAGLVPGLLADALAADGIPSAASVAAGRARLIGADGDGVVKRPGGCPPGGCEGLTVVALELEQLDPAISRLREDDLLIAFPRASPWRRLLPIAIAGEGFVGSLRSPTTRLDGYLLSTDLAPTVLARFGAEVPAEMTGRPVEGGGERTVGELGDLLERLEEVGPRRTPVIAHNLAAWIVVAVALALLGGRARSWALAAIAVTLALAPAILVGVVALEPSETLERLIVGAGTPLAALALLVAAVRAVGSLRAPWGAFAVAAAISLLVVAADVVAGSPLTSLSLIGPNPGLGVRFFGIGNELEATIAMLVVLGSGAAVTALRPARPERAVVVVAFVATAVAVAAFAPGRFGAAVGAAITFPAAAAGLAIAALGVTRARLVALALAPLAAFAALVAVDIAAGGDAHLTRSVLEAGGLEGLGEVVERRTRLAAASFTRFAEAPFYMLALLLIAAGVAFRRRIWSLYGSLPAARAGLAGAVTAAVVGTVANDSGALLLVVSVAYIAAFVALAVAARRSADPAAGAER